MLWNYYGKNDNLNSGRFVCRQYLFALLLRKMENNFTYLYDDEARILARRIILYLNNKNAEIIKPVTFLTLARAVLHAPYDGGPSIIDTADDLRLQKFLEVLYLMNERRWDENGWADVINIENKISFAYKPDDFKKIYARLYINRNISNSNNIDIDPDINITDAGRFFSTFISYFEYFARKFLFQTKNGDLISDSDYFPIFTYFLPKSNSSASEVAFRIKDYIKNMNTIIRSIINELKNTITEPKVFLRSNNDFDSEKINRKIYQTPNSLLFGYHSGNAFTIYAENVINKTIGYIENILIFLDDLIKNHKNIFGNECLEKFPNYANELRLIQYKTLKILLDLLNKLKEVVNENPSHFKEYSLLNRLNMAIATQNDTLQEIDVSKLNAFVQDKYKNENIIKFFEQIEKNENI